MMSKQEGRVGLFRSILVAAIMVVGGGFIIIPMISDVHTARSLESASDTELKEITAKPDMGRTQRLAMMNIKIREAFRENANSVSVEDLGGHYLCFEGYRYLEQWHTITRLLSPENRPIPCDSPDISRSLLGVETICIGGVRYHNFITSAYKAMNKTLIPDMTKEGKIVECQ